uniref:Uncharacterized protein n=1 Tax=Anguilla anguilla TaxID=7936 RepID=A0A0E9W7R4_ANGAN
MRCACCTKHKAASVLLKVFHFIMILHVAACVRAFAPLFPHLSVTAGRMKTSRGEYQRPE